MEIYFKRYFWLLPIVVIIVCSALAAKAATAVIDAKLISADAPKSTTPKRRPAKTLEAPKTATKDSEAVVARNMFCSTCDPVKVEPVAATPTAPVDNDHPPATDLPLALVGTIVSSNDKYSTATILNATNYKSGSYAVDEIIPDAGPIVRIKPKYVDFMNTGNHRVERINLGAPPGKGERPVVAAAPAAPTVSTPENASPETDLMAAADKGIHKLDDNRYDIDRSLVDKVLADPTAAARMARIVPSIKDGKANGFKLYAIRPNSLFAKIGLQNGDTIQGINGFDMSSPDKALEVYTKVRSASSLSVNVLRRGQSVTLEYSIK